MPATPVPTPSAPPVAGPYSPAVRAGDWLILSGQVGFDPATGLMAEGIEAQTQKVMENIAAILIDCGVAIADVAKTLVFVTDLSDFAVVNQIYGEAMGDHRPARSTVQVAGLPGGALVEIETWAYVG
jgi:2-iminobutanoate/2-iminopropanoate deaminase